MKKGLMAFVACAVALTVGASQVSAKSFDVKDLKYGVRLALGSSNNSASGQTSGFGFNLGGTAEWAMNDKIAFSSGLNYASLGSKNGNTDETLSYLEVPVLVKYTLPQKANQFSFNLQGGLSLGYLIAATAGGKDVKSSRKKADYALILGVGTSMPCPKRQGSRLDIDLTYKLGLADVNPGGNSKNSFIALGAGYAF